MKKLVILFTVFIFSALQVQAAPVVTHFDAAGAWPILGDGDDRPSTVRAMQYLLRARGYYVLVDGRFGQKTRYQAHRFRQNTGIFRDPGIVDGETWEYLAPNLKRGDKGWAVRAAQTLLRANGCEIVLDGQFGIQTERAVHRFQEQHDLLQGVVEPGVVERFTWLYLTGGKAYSGGEG